MECITAERVISITPMGWPHWTYSSEGLYRDDFIAIAASGSVTVEHDPPRDAM